MKKFLYFLPTILLLSCGFTKEQNINLNNPLTAYRKGNYREIIQKYDKHPPNSLVELYIYGRSLMELRHYEKAVDIFQEIPAKTLLKSESSYLYPFFVKNFLEAITRNTNLSTNIAQTDFTSMINDIPETFVLKSNIKQNLFYALWLQQRYQQILEMDASSLSGKAWKEFAKYALHQPYNIDTLIEGYSSFKEKNLYIKIISNIQPQNIKNPKQAQILANASMRFTETRPYAIKFAKRYTELTKNKDFTAEIQAESMRRNGKRLESAQYLYKYLVNNKASLQLHRIAHQRLFSAKLFNEGIHAAELGYQRYGSGFKLYYQDVVEFQKNAEQTFNWYKKNVTKLPNDIHNQVIRALIRTDMLTAEKAVELGKPYNQSNTSFLLLTGLVKEHLQKEEEAYRIFTDIYLQEPFSYEGIVAQKKEKLLRHKYKNIFQEKLEQTLNKFPDLKLDDRLMISKALLLDKETKKEINFLMFQKDKLQFEKKILDDLTKLPDIPELENYNHNLTNFSAETLDFIQATVNQKVSGKNFYDKARYYFKYRDILIDSDLEGYLTFELYFYIRSKNSASHIPIYPEEVLSATYPKPEYEYILSLNNNNKEMTRWMLSSFMAESHFRKRVSSHVGAIGFAQVMPYTAQSIRMWMKKPCLSNFDFYDNLRMGIFYHNKVYSIFNNHPRGLAAYNAGPNPIKRWSKNYSYIKDDSLFIEAMDYKETRNYVKVIVYNYEMYKLFEEMDII